MNGATDEADETVTTDDFNAILSYAQAHHIARPTFWAVDRDRPGDSGGGAGDSCSGVAQSPYGFTKIFAQYTG